MSIDRQLIVDQVLNGLAYPSTDIVTPPIPGSRDDACGYCVYDPEQAKTLLEESGVDPRTRRWSTTSTPTPVTTRGSRRLPVRSRRTWASTTSCRPPSGLSTSSCSTRADFTGPFRLGWSLDYPSPENYIRPIAGTDGDSNYGGYSNPEVDDLLTQADEAPTLEESFALYQQAGDVALEDMPIIPMWSGETAIAYSDEVTGVAYDQGDGEINFKEISVNQ